MTRGRGLVGSGVLGGGPAVGQRLADLAVVAVDGQRLQAHLPALDVDLLDLLDRRVLGQVDRLGDRTGQERLDRGHHPDVAHGRDGARAHGGVEDLVVLGLQAGGVDDVALVGDVLDDRLDGLLGVAELAQGPRDREVDDLHRAATDELLELHEREVGLDAGGVAVHHEADGPGGGEHRRLGVAVAVLLAELDDVVPRLGGDAVDVLVHRADGADRVVGGGVLAHDPLVGVGVAGVPGVRADDRGELGGALVGGTGEQRGDRRGDGAATLGVVPVAGGHEQRAEVGVADAELAVVTRGVADGLGREVGEADRDVHRGDDELDDLLELRGVEGVVVAQELQEVERGQVARGVVERHVLRARVGRGDAAGLGVGVPVVDRAVVLDARVGALPRGLGDLAHELAGVDGLDDRAVLARGAGRTPCPPRRRA